MDAARTDIAILGGGLAGGLIALALTKARPDVSLRLIERADTLGGNHVWSFFASDLPHGAEELIAPLVEAAWSGYDVRFPAYNRTLETRYRATTSQRLNAALRRALPTDAIMTGAEVISATATNVLLANGTSIAAGAVIDARGLGNYGSLSGGWQKFLGQRLKLARPHGLVRPVVMDATVAQHDGYRFVYCLPFAPDEVFVEDTYYSDGPELDRKLLAGRISAYADEQGWRTLGVISEEQGVLPVVAAGDLARMRHAARDGPALAGTRAGLFHPLTSYSLPDAMRFALALVRQRDLGAASLGAFCAKYARDHWKQRFYYRKLTALLFAAAQPDQRYRVLQRFYKLDPRLIERFYAGQSTWGDKLRILTGAPPVPVGAAVGVLSGLGAKPGRLNEAGERWA